MIFKTITDETTISGQRIVGALEARKIAQQRATVQLETDIACLKKYEIACQSGSVSTEQFDAIMKKASITAKEYQQIFRKRLVLLNHMRRHKSPITQHCSQLVSEPVFLLKQ